MSHKIFDKNLVAICKCKLALKLNKPAFIGTFILELSKVLIYEFRKRCSVRKGVLKNFAKFVREHLAQVFFCEFCKISKKTFFTEYLRANASEVFD